MNRLWFRTRLNDVVKPVERATSPLPGTTYRQIGVKLWGEGAYERESIDGSQTKYARLFRAEAGDIIVNKIWARNGSVAVVNDTLAGCYGSGEFPMFAPSPDRLESRWMHWLTKTRSFWAQCDEKARGTSGQNRIRPERFLEIEIPLPPLAEQRRIVARIEELATQIFEARSLRDQAATEAETVVSSFASALFDHLKCDRKALGEVVEKRTGVAYKAEDFAESGGVPVVRLKEISSKTPTVFLRNPEDYANVWLEVGDIILAKTSFSTGAMCQWAGPRAVLNQNAVMLRAKNGIEQRFVFAWLGQQVHRYLDEHLADPKFYPYIREADLIRWLVPAPPLPEQRRIVAELDALQTKVDSLKRLQAETAAELDALLPAILDRAFKGKL
jgi:type I restriction enzyme S subunit